MVDQRQRRLADVVQMSYTCFVFAWYGLGTMNLVYMLCCVNMMYMSE